MRGARGDAPPTTSARGRGRERAGALRSRRRRPRALQDEAVWAPERARRRLCPRAEGTHGPRVAGADGCGGDSDPGRESSACRRPVSEAPAASLARGGRRPLRLAVTRASVSATAGVRAALTRRAGAVGRAFGQVQPPRAGGGEATTRAARGRALRSGRLPAPPHGGPEPSPAPPSWDRPAPAARDPAPAAARRARAGELGGETLPFIVVSSP